MKSASKPLAPPATLGSEGWFQALAEASAAALFVFREDRTLFVNAACSDLTGYSHQELLAMLPWQLTRSEDHDFHRRQAAGRLRGEPIPTVFEIPIVRKDGEERRIEATTAILDLPGEPPALVTTAIDVTLRYRQGKMSEERLRASA